MAEQLSPRGNATTTANVNAPRPARIRTTDDLEVSSYLEIAREKRGDRLADRPASRDTHETIVIIDFGSQYSMLIARRIRALNVYCELVPHTASWEQVQALNPKGFILSGGPASVTESNAPQAPPYIYESGLPVLGICYGMQVIAATLGGRVVAEREREYGHAVVHHAVSDGDGSPLLAGLPESMPVWMSHGDRIAEPPPGFRALASSESIPLAAMGNDDNIYGIQFHPEVVHTPRRRPPPPQLRHRYLRLPRRLDRRAFYR